MVIKLSVLSVWRRLWHFDPVTLVSWAFVLLVVGLQLIAPAEEFDRLLAAVPALAASRRTVVGTAGMGLLAVVTEAFLMVLGGPGNIPLYRPLTVIVIVTVAAMVASHARQQRERTLVQVRSVAEAAQRALLRPAFPDLGHVSAEALYLAAAAQARIGGDFYEIQPTPFGVRVLVGDVRGKGLPAVETAAVILGSFRENTHTAPTLPHLARRLEASIHRHTTHIPGGETGEDFATCALAEIPEKQAIIRTVTCGHPAPLLLHHGQVLELQPTEPAPPLNLGILAGGDYTVDVYPFTAGDQVLFYTDGVSETRNPAGEFYPLPERICPWAGMPPRQLLASLHHDLAAYSHGHLDDDVAALVVRRLPHRT